MLTIAKFDRYDMINNPGDETASITIWFSGCNLRCKNCHNRKLWDAKHGHEHSAKAVAKIVSDGKELPTPTDAKNVIVEDGGLLSLVDVDFVEYRRKNDMKVVKKNCTLPSWLCYEAERANINFSQVLQAAIKRELNIADYKN